MKKGSNTTDLFYVDEELIIILREMIHEYRVYKRLSVGIEVGKHLTRIRDKQSYGFLIWCRKKLYLSEFKARVFLLMAEHPDFALESRSQAEFMRKIEPNNSRFRLTRQPKAKPMEEDPWGVGELAYFFYNYGPLPTEIKASFYTIRSVDLFIDSHLKIVTDNNGDPQFKAHLDRLTEVRDILIKNSD